VTLLLSAHSAPITPGPGYRLGGYLARKGVATGALDDLEASLVWLSTEDDPGVLWVALDALATDTGLTRTLADAVTTTVGIPGDRVLVCASHTHSAPEGWTDPIHPAVPGERDPGLVRRLTETITAAARSLAARRAPVTGRWYDGEAGPVGANRYRVDGPHDDSVGVLELRYAGGGPSALVFDYANHPTVLGPDNLAWSADWPGATRRMLGTPVTAFLQGAAGDASSRFVRRGRDHAEVSALGGVLAGSIVRVLTQRSPLTVNGPVRMTRATVPLAYRELPTAAESLQLCRQAEAEWSGLLTWYGDDDPAVRIARTCYEGSLMLAEMAAADGFTGTVSVPISVVSLDDVAWVHTPFELFASLGLRIRRASPFRCTRVIGYTDGYAGYLPDADAYRDGIYEAYISLFGPDAADVVVRHCVELLRTHHAVSGGAVPE
jgi:hypothetical protein